MVIALGPTWPIWGTAGFLGLALIALVGRNIHRTRRHHFATLAWQLTEVGHLYPTLPPELHETQATLQSLGFRLLGVALEKPSAIPAEDLPHLPPTWYWVDDRDTIVAEVLWLDQAGKYIQFSTRFVNQVYLETSVAQGESLNLPTYKASIAPDLPQAYQVHKAQLSAWQTEGHLSQGIANLSQVIAWDAIYRREHLPHRLQALVRHQTRQHVGMGLILLALLAFPLLALAFLFGV